MIPPRSSRKSDKGDGTSLVSAAHEKGGPSHGMKVLNVGSRSPASENGRGLQNRGSKASDKMKKESATLDEPAYAEKLVMESAVVETSESRGDSRERHPGREGSGVEAVSSTTSANGERVRQHESALRPMRSAAGSSGSPFGGDVLESDKNISSDGRGSSKLSPGSSDGLGATSAASSSSSADKHVVEVEGVWGWEPRRRTSDGRATVRVFVAGRNGFTTRSRSPQPQAYRNTSQEREPFHYESGGEEARAEERQDPEDFCRRDNEARRRNSQSRSAVITSAEECASKETRKMGGGALTEVNEEPADPVDSPDHNIAELATSDQWSKLKVRLPRLDKPSPSERACGPPTSSVTPPPHMRMNGHEEAQFGVRELERNADRCWSSREFQRAVDNDENRSDDSRRYSRDSGRDEEQREYCSGSSSPRVGLSRESQVSGEAGTNTIGPYKSKPVDDEGDTKDQPGYLMDCGGGKPNEPDDRGGASSTNNGDRGHIPGSCSAVEVDGCVQKVDNTDSRKSVARSTREMESQPPEQAAVTAQSTGSDRDWSSVGQNRPALSLRPVKVEQARGSGSGGEQEVTLQGSSVDSRCGKSSGGPDGENATAGCCGGEDIEGVGIRDGMGEGGGARAEVKLDGEVENTTFSEDAVPVPAAKVMTPAPVPAPDKRESKSESMVEVQALPSGGIVYSLKPGTPRRGKWCRLEQEYAKRVISDFDEGLLDVEPGTGLRQLLASKLQCEVMRVSKKFCGLESVGKRSFRPVRNQEARVHWAQESLFAMEQRWLASFFPNNSAARTARDSGSCSPSAVSPKNLMRLVSAPLSGEPDRVGCMDGVDTQSPRWVAPPEHPGELLDAAARERELYGHERREMDAAKVVGSTTAAGRSAHYANAWRQRDAPQHGRAWGHVAEPHAGLPGPSGAHDPGSWGGDGPKHRWDVSSAATEIAVGDGAGRDENGWRRGREERRDATEEDQRPSWRHRHPYGWVPNGGAYHQPDDTNVVGGPPGWHPRHSHHTDVDQHRSVRSSAGWEGVRDEPSHQEFTRERDYYERGTGAVGERSRQPQQASEESGREEESSNALYPIYSKKARYYSVATARMEDQGISREEPGVAVSRPVPLDPFRGGGRERPPRRPYSPVMISREDGEGVRGYGGGAGGGGSGSGGSERLWRNHYESEPYPANEARRSSKDVYHQAYGSAALVEARHQDYPPEGYPADHSYGGRPDDREREYRDAGSRDGSRAGWRPVETYPPGQQHRPVAQLPPHLRVDNSSSAVFFPGDSGVRAAVERSTSHRGKVSPPVPSLLSAMECAPRRGGIMEHADEQAEQPSRWTENPHEHPTKICRVPGFLARQEGGGSSGRDHEEGYSYDQVGRSKRSWAGGMIRRANDGPAGMCTTERWRSETEGYDSSLQVSPHPRKTAFHPAEGGRIRDSFTVPVGGGIVMPPEGRVVLRVEGQGVEVHGKPNRMGRQR